MGLFNRASQQAGGPTMRARALVVDAEAPPLGAPHVGSRSRGTIRILVDFGAGPVQVTGEFQYRDDRWLVRGMDVDVMIDPARPQRFEVGWAAIPSMQERAAANDPTLADPFGAGRRVAHALGLTKADTGTSCTDAFRAALDKAAGTPAPPGKLRAVVLVATIRGRFESGGGDYGPSTDSITTTRNSPAVLAVNVPGRAPYAVFVPKFKFPRLRHDILGGGLPALVSADDPADIDVRWDELPSMQSQIAERMAGAAAQAQQRASQAYAMRDQMLAATRQDVPGPGGAIPAAGAASLAEMAPQMRQMAIDNLKQSLRYVPDPAMRQMMIDQYRAAGIDLDQGDVTP